MYENVYERAYLATSSGDVRLLSCVKMSAEVSENECMNVGDHASFCVSQTQNCYHCTPMYRDHTQTRHRKMTYAASGLDCAWRAAERGSGLLGPHIYDCPWQEMASSESGSWSG